MKAIWFVASTCVLGSLAGCSSAPSDLAESSSAAVEVSVSTRAHTTLPADCGSLGDAYSSTGQYTYCVLKEADILEIALGDKTFEAPLPTTCSITLEWRSNTLGASWKTLAPLDCYAPPDVLGPSDVAIQGASPGMSVVGVRPVVRSIVLGQPVTSGPVANASVSPPSMTTSPLRPMIDIDIRRAFNILPEECNKDLMLFLDKLGADWVLRAALENERKKVPQNRQEIQNLQDQLALVHAKAEEIACRLVKCVTGDSDTLAALLNELAKLVGFPMPNCKDGKPVGGGGAPAGGGVQLPANGGLQFVPVKPNDG